MRGERVARQRKRFDRGNRCLENGDGVGTQVIEGSVQ